MWYVSSSQSLAATRKRRALLLGKKEKREGWRENTAISVLSVQPRTKPRGASLEGAALSPTALGVEAAGGALRPRRPGQSPPSDPGAQCRQLRGARSSDEAGLGRVRATSRSNTVLNVYYSSIKLEEKRKLSKTSHILRC